jgi:hypothetical protein
MHPHNLTIVPAKKHLSFCLGHINDHQLQLPCKCRSYATECNRAPFDTVLTEQERKAEQKYLGNHPIPLPHDSPRAA